MKLVKGTMQLKIRHWLVSLLIFSGLMLGGCSPEQATLSSPNSSTTQTSSIPPTQASSPQMKDLPVLEGNATVVLTVKGSPITIEVDGTNAQITAGNFVDLVQRGVYDGLMFHRVVPAFVAQAGDPQSKDPKFPPQSLGTGGFSDPKTGTQRYIPLEIKPQGATSPIYSRTLDDSSPPQLKHTLGAVAMARSQQPDSASSQFYITLAEQSFLDGKYAVFGKVTDGMDVVAKIAQGDRIESAKVTQGLENLKNAGS